MTLKYIGVPETYSATIMAVESNVVQVSGPSLTMHESGFTITDDNGNEFDYIWPGTFSGEFWKIPVGESSVTRSAGATLVIEPKWRWI